MIKQILWATTALLLTLTAMPYASAQDYPNEVIEAIHKRSSVRSYSSREVPREVLMELVGAGMAAPSGANKQPWEFIVVEDREVLDQIAKSKKMFAGAKAAIVVAGHSDGDGDGSIYWYQDCSAAAQNILLAAHSLGLGAVWTTVHPHAQLESSAKELFDLPDGVTALCIIAIGYPNSEPKPKKKWDAEKIHYNKW